MAAGFLKSFNSDLEVLSAGTKPSEQVHPLAIQVMEEANVDISQSKPMHLDMYLDEAFDYVITVCGDAQTNCPVFIGEVSQRLHIGFEDPDKLTGTREEVLANFRRIRDEIKLAFHTFYKSLNI